ncbi:MAG: hypothetical protein AAF518_15265 [Spirochaetota bacterium]
MKLLPILVCTCLFSHFFFPTRLSAYDFRILLDPVYFSPNYDGRQDTITFRLAPETLKQYQKVVNWQLTVQDERGHTIFRFQADLRHKKQQGFLGYFMGQNKDKQIKTVALPANLEWNGIASSGKIPSDGRYIAKMQFTSLNNERFLSFPKYFYLDSQSPTPQVSSTRMFLTPNQDTIFDKLRIKQDIRGEKSDRWQGSFFDAQNKPIRTYLWKTKEVPKVLLWDGKDDRGILQDQGFFTYKLSSYDFAGNREEAVLKNIFLGRVTGNIGIHSNLDKFSPNGDRFEDKVTFFPTIPKTLVPQEWKFVIYQTEEEEIIWKKFSGTGALPPSFLWDGKSEKGEVVEDGIYSYRLEIKALNRSKTIISTPRKLTVASNKLYIRFTINHDSFTPDNDGEKDFLEIYPKLKNFSTKSWTIHLLEKYYNKDGVALLKTIRKWRGKGTPPQRILWNGLGDDGVRIGSLAELEVYFYFKNDLGESKYYKVKSFQSGILVRKAPRKADSLQISIPEYKFRNQPSQTIQQLLAVLDQYPQYKLRLESHSRQPGENQQNQFRTEERARELFAKLFGKKEPFARFDFRGFGEVSPLFFDTSLYHQEKNERIDIVLTLSKEEK